MHVRVQRTTFAVVFDSVLGSLQTTMNSRTVPRLTTLLLVLLALPPTHAADGWTSYRTKPGTNTLVKVEGTSTLHDWRCISRNIGGTFETGPDFTLDPAKLKPGEKLPLRVTLGIPVRSLKSVKEDLTPYMTSMDDVMYEHMREPLAKRISYTLDELVVQEAPANSNSNAPLQFEARGWLAVAGVTNAVTMPVQLAATEAGLTITGRIATKMTDFDIKPPAPAMMPIKTGDDVQLSFSWMVIPKK